MSCDEATDLLALDAVGAIEASDREVLERHVATCATCEQTAAQYADLASLLPSALELAPPPARLRRRLMAQVYAESTAPKTLRWGRRLVAAIPANRAFTVVGAVAVVAAVAFGIWGATGRSASPAPVAYTVSGTTPTGTLAVGTTGTQAVLTVQGLERSPAPRSTRSGSSRDTAHPGGSRSSAPVRAVGHGPPSSREALPGTRASRRPSSLPEGVQPPPTPRC